MNLECPKETLTITDKTMNLQEIKNELKTRIPDRVTKVVTENLRSMSERFPVLNASSAIIGKAAGNAVRRMSETLDKDLGTLSYLFADENGNINVKDVVSDILSMLDVMEEKEFVFPFGTMSVGKGSVIFKPSESILTNILLGNVDSIKMTGREIADMLFGHLITDDV